MPDKFQIEGNLDVDGAAGITGIVTAPSFVRNGGTSSQFLKADGSVDSNTYLTSDNDTTYAISADNAGSDKSIVLTAGGAGSGISSVVLEGGENVTITRAGNKISIASTYTDSNTDTTYNEFTGTTAGLVPTSTNSDDTKFLRADGTWVVPTDTNTDTNTTYDLGAVDGTGQQAKIQLTGSDSSTDEVKITAGTNLSLTRSSNDITLSIPSNITVGNITADNVSVAQTLTYEDVTNIDSVAIVSARTGVKVLSGGINVVGVVTASSFDGDVTGSATGLSGTPDITARHILTSGITTFNGDVNFPGATYNIHWDQPTSKFKFDDNAQCVFGTASGGDLRIFHAGGNSTIKNETGQFKIDGNDIRLQNQNGSEDYLLAVDGGSVSIFHNDVKRLETTASGVDITGHIETDTLNVGTGVTIGAAGVATAHNLHVGGILKGKSTNNVLTLDSHIIPTQNAAYDLGNAEFKIRHLFLSDNSLKFVDSSNNEYPVSVSSGNLTYSSGKIHDSSGSTREIVNASKTAAYTLTAANVGGLINTNSDVTVPSGIFSAGQAITIYNNSGGNISVKRSGTTIWTAGTDNNTDKTLAQKGVCTVLCVSSDTFVASGAGMS